ncbi:hypothetical protein ABXS69_09375 [Actinomyces timonensis]|uniref:Uncharacterized protein n=1 Tax=Actinomyces timonensis TaxID=1288391 RepID=A0AAU8N425_9ACTO
MTEASTVNLPPLQSGSWSYGCSRTGSLTDILTRACSGPGSQEWQGIAYTTAGARALRTVSNNALGATDGQQVPLGSVYELRLWALIEDPRPQAGADDAGVLAHELRWLNGSGTAEIVLRSAAGAPTATTDAAPEPGQDTCWYRPNSYLQHGATAPFDADDEMTSVEIFTEDDYGNIVFVDELMTGAWG